MQSIAHMSFLNFKLNFTKARLSNPEFSYEEAALRNTSANIFGTSARFAIRAHRSHDCARFSLRPSSSVPLGPTSRKHFVLSPPGGVGTSRPCFCSFFVFPARCACSGAGWNDGGRRHWHSRRRCGRGCISACFSQGWAAVLGRLKQPEKLRKEIPVYGHWRTRQSWGSFNSLFPSGVFQNCKSSAAENLRVGLGGTPDGDSLQSSVIHIRCTKRSCCDF